jgi:hypothetical protein
MENMPVSQKWFERHNINVIIEIEMVKPLWACKINSSVMPTIKNIRYN